MAKKLSAGSPATADKVGSAIPENVSVSAEPETGLVTPKKSDRSDEVADNDDDYDLKLFLEPDSMEDDWIPTSQKSPANTTVDEKIRSLFKKHTFSKAELFRPRQLS